MAKSEADLNDNPTTADFRSRMDDYLAAASSGHRFHIFRYRYPIGILGSVDEMPNEFREKAQRVSFSNARSDFPSITKTLLRGSALIVTKRIRGPHTRPKRGGRSFAIANDVKEIAAIWPLPQNAVAALVASEVRQLASTQKEMVTALDQMLKSITPLLRKLHEIDVLDEEIMQKQKILKNFETTVRRVGTHN